MTAIHGKPYLGERGTKQQKHAMRSDSRRTVILPPDTLKKDGVLEEDMQQSQLTTYADIAEVRTVSGAAACNQLLAEGWVLLGVYPLTTVAEMTTGQPSDGQEQNKRQDIQRYVRRFVGYVLGRRRE